MVFSSSVFLLAFLPLFLVAYFAVPARRWRNGVLLAASLAFYAWGEPVYVLLMIVSILVNWVSGLLMGSNPERKKAVLAGCLAVNLAILGFFKYEGFLAQTVNALAGAVLLPDLQLPLPIGISFFTLQAITYVADVYRNKVEPQRNLLRLAVYIAMFPQLVAGPIVRYQTIADQITNRQETLRGFTAGARLFTIGLAKKVLLANIVAILATSMMEAGARHVGFVGAWGGLIAFTFQIYFDFSGYSDMAIGLGKMCGFSYLRNFNYPYISKSVTEFWRRWHISLGTFFRDYVYIPLGGSRCSRRRWALNLLVVWSLTGLWHGAAWNFVLWGLFNLVVLLAEKLWLRRVLGRLPWFVQNLYAMIVVMLGWMLFWNEGLPACVEYLAALLGVFGACGEYTFWGLQVWAYLPVFAVCFAASTPAVTYMRERLMAWARGERLQGFMQSGLASVGFASTVGLCDFEGYLAQCQPVASERRLLAARLVFAGADIALLALLMVSLGAIVAGSFNPFIYFRF